MLSDGGSVLKDPTVLEADEKEKKKATASRFETLRAYLKDLSHLKRKAVKKESERSTYATSEEVADNLLEHDVTFFEPLKHLPSCAQELCRDIARDKMMQVATKLTQEYYCARPCALFDFDDPGSVNNFKLQALYLFHAFFSTRGEEGEGAVIYFASPSDR